MPAYHSTDFDVHRNWKALTRHLPRDEWYFDNINGTTVHTLDYPPSFAYFEKMWSTNMITEYLLKRKWLKERCLALLPDTDNDVDMTCVVFMRTTVIISDVVFWWGAWIASTTAITSDTTEQHLTFLLMTLNPGLLWLDHVHFQYNGMLLGILLASLGFLLKPTTTFHVFMAAVLYTLLLTMKHLYICLAPLYLVFLIKHYCVVHGTFQVWRFLHLAGITVTCIILLFLPFLELHQLQQILTRLFPFGRGLCHDYPAANVWSLYLVADKVLLLAFTGRNVEWSSLPQVTPLTTALLLLLSLLPGLYACTKSKHSLIMSVVYCAFCTFMLSFHVHEKAIMTALVPLTLVSTTNIQTARLFLRTSALGLMGLFPLLFRVEELGLKVWSYLGYMCMSVYILEMWYGETRLLTRMDYVGMMILFAVALFLEVLHPLFLYPWMEALPLLLTSVVCAAGLILCWIQSGRLLFQDTSGIGVAVKEKTV